jgi:hypothetical protein
MQKGAGMGSWGRWPDVVAADTALVVVVVASVTTERAASALGTGYAVPEIVTGRLVLAAVIRLPNAVAPVYLAARGRGGDAEHRGPYSIDAAAHRLLEGTRPASQIDRICDRLVRAVRRPGRRSYRRGCVHVGAADRPRSVIT